MSKIPQVLWLSTSTHLQRFDRPLRNYLSRHLSIGHWQYAQEPDEPGNLEIPLVLLHEYLKTIPQPIHLIGHGINGFLGLLYARKYPQKVKSLTLLAVGIDPAVDWHAHYYALRELFPCCQQMILARMVYNLFGHQKRQIIQDLMALLQSDLNESPSLHSLWRRHSEPAGGVEVPLMVCGNEEDAIVDRNSLLEWQKHFKDGDRLWLSSEGSHMFHFFYPQYVGKQILRFWQFHPQPDNLRSTCPHLN